MYFNIRRPAQASGAPRPAFSSGLVDMQTAVKTEEILQQGRDLGRPLQEYAGRSLAERKVAGKLRSVRHAKLLSQEQEAELQVLQASGASQPASKNLMEASAEVVESRIGETLLMSDPIQCFLDSSYAAVRRRRKRLHDRSRKRKREDNRTDRRTKRLPCCGRERRYCKCAQEVEHLFNDVACDMLAAQAYQRNLLTKLDPKDMSFILRALHQSELSIHGFLFHSVLFTMYSRESTYRALSEYAGAAQPGKDEPDWLGMEGALVKLYAESHPVWGGLSYVATLTAVKDERGWWRMPQTASPTQQAKTDMRVFTTVWAALCKDESAATYMKQRRRCSSTCWKQKDVDAARQAFRRWYDCFYDYMNCLTKGWFGDYAMKRILEVGANCTIKATNDNMQVFPDALVSKWPVNCPAYKTGVEKLLKPEYRRMAMSAELKFKVMMYVHAKLAKKLGAAHHSVSSTLAQICRQRRVHTSRAPR